ncbi:hypothetical protein [Pseudomonas phage D6]|nr:hypothetical protein [Pseudomonas phage D6]
MSDTINVPVVTKQDLEKAYAVLDDLERKMIESSRVARVAFFSEVQSQVNDRNVPIFQKGATMSQAFRMGMDAGVEATLVSIDNCSIVMTDGRERILNVDHSVEGPDIIPIADMWAGYINS